MTHNPHAFDGIEILESRQLCSSLLALAPTRLAISNVLELVAVVGI